MPLFLKNKGNFADKNIKDNEVKENNMGLSASQARFLQLTARRSNVEYQAQQINQQRLQLASKLEGFSNEYQEKVSNRKMVFRFNNGSEVQNVDVTYQNYKNIMNQQQVGLDSTHQKYFLVSSSGHKLVVASAEDRKTMIEKSGKDEKGNPLLNADDFMIVENLEDPDAFQLAIQNGDYYFATMNDIEYDKYGNPIVSFAKDGWETIGGGVIQEQYDRTDDAEAEATFKKQQAKIQKQDKMLEMELSKLESERNAIQTEIDSVTKVIDENIEQGFKAFS